MVSVQSVDEFKQIQRTGVTWVDMKDPSHGALQPTPSSVWESVGQHTGYQLSVALGEFVDHKRWAPETVPDAITYVKVGLSNVECLADWENRWLDWCKAFSSQFKPVVVAYADYLHCGAPTPQTLLKLAAQAPFGGFLIDTFDKTRGSVFCHTTSSQLKTWLDEARRIGLKTVLGGSLRQENIEMALECCPDVIAVRGAVTQGKRNAAISSHRVSELLERVRKERLGNTLPRCSPQPDAV